MKKFIRVFKTWKFFMSLSQLPASLKNAQYFFLLNSSFIIQFKTITLFAKESKSFCEKRSESMNRIHPYLVQMMFSAVSRLTSSLISSFLIQKWVWEIDECHRYLCFEPLLEGMEYRFFSVNALNIMRSFREEACQTIMTCYFIFHFWKKLLKKLLPFVSLNLNSSSLVNDS